MTNPASTNPPVNNPPKIPTPSKIANTAPIPPAVPIKEPEKKPVENEQVIFIQPSQPQTIPVIPKTEEHKEAAPKPVTEPTKIENPPAPAEEVKKDIPLPKTKSKDKKGTEKKPIPERTIQTRSSNKPKPAEEKKHSDESKPAKEVKKDESSKKEPKKSPEKKIVKKESAKSKKKSKKGKSKKAPVKKEEKEGVVVSGKRDAPENKEEVSDENIKKLKKE